MFHRAAASTIRNGARAPAFFKAPIRPITTTVIPGIDGKNVTPGTKYGSTVTVTLIPGDGIGPEITKSVEEIFKAAKVPVEWEKFEVSGLSPANSPTLQQAIDSIRRNKVALKGVLYTAVDKLAHTSFNQFIRKDLDVFASVSIIKSLPGNWPTRHKNVDLVIVRENTEGEYAGLEHSPVDGVVESLKVVSKPKTERIAKYAFDLALKNGRKNVTAIHKANIMKLGDGLFLKTAREVGKTYESSGVTVKDMIVDNASMQLVSRPGQFDVIVCGNLYGNILSNVGAGIVGGPGIVAGANFGRDYAIFEPGCRHVAEDIKGKNVANPTGMIFSAVHLLEHLGFTEKAKQINDAVLKVLSEGKVLTPDLKGSSSTTDFTKEVIKNL